MSNDLVVTTMNIGRSGEIGRNGEIGRSGKIGRSDEIVDKLNPNTNMANVRPLRPNIGRCGKIVEKLNPNTNTNVFDEIVVKFKFKFNAMKLLENKNVFVNDFVNKPPKLKFKVMKLVENKSVVLSWVYLQPYEHECFSRPDVEHEYEHRRFSRDGLTTTSPSKHDHEHEVEHVHEHEHDHEHKSKCFSTILRQANLANLVKMTMADLVKTATAEKRQQPKNGNGRNFTVCIGKIEN